MMMMMLGDGDVVADSFKEGGDYCISHNVLSLRTFISCHFDELCNCWYCSIESVRRASVRLTYNKPPLHMENRRDEHLNQVML